MVNELVYLVVIFLLWIVQDTGYITDESNCIVKIEQLVLPVLVMLENIQELSIL